MKQSHFIPSGRYTAEKDINVWDLGFSRRCKPRTLLVFWAKAIITAPWRWMNHAVLNRLEICARYHRITPQKTVELCVWELTAGSWTISWNHLVGKYARSLFPIVSAEWIDEKKPNEGSNDFCGFPVKFLYNPPPRERGCLSSQKDAGNKAYIIIKALW
jgi:hypothetical protein